MLIAPKRLKVRTSNLAGVFPGAYSHTLTDLGTVVVIRLYLETLCRSGSGEPGIPKSQIHVSRESKDSWSSSVFVVNYNAIRPTITMRELQCTIYNIEPH